MSAKAWARQIPWEYQHSPLEFCDWEFGIPIAVFGNRFYQGHIDEKLKNVWDRLKEGELTEIIEEFEKYGEHRHYKNVTEAIQDYLAPWKKARYSTKEIHDLKKLVVDCSYATKGDEDEILTTILGIVTGEPWETTIIRGSCQGDWQYVLYPSNKWTSEDVRIFEMEYFNLGSEWMVHDGKEPPESPDDISGFCMYCYSYDEEGIAKEIANEVGCDPSEVVLYKYVGDTRVPQYKKVENGKEVN